MIPVWRFQVVGISWKLAEASHCQLAAAMINSTVCFVCDASKNNTAAKCCQQEEAIQYVALWEPEFG